MSAKDRTRLDLEMYTTDVNRPLQANGHLVFHKDESRYEGFITLKQPVSLTDETVHGQEIETDGLTAIEFRTIDRTGQEELKLLLVKNRYDQRADVYAGSAIYPLTGIYNVCGYAE